MERICAAVIVTYNADTTSFEKNLVQIKKQIKKVIIVDNGSANAQNVQAIAGTADIELIMNNSNIGLAAALNQGFLAAYNQGFKWCISLDQDTFCRDNMINTLFQNIDEKIGILCPAVRYKGIEKKVSGIGERQQVTACMTSGSLTNLNAWKRVGGFEESYFIDFVDNEFCMKLRIEGYMIIRINSCWMDHNLGEYKERKILGVKTVRFLYHNPSRYYYMIRNNLLFIKEYRCKLNVFKEYIKVIYIMASGWVYTTQKKETLKYIYLGIKDACIGKKGFLDKR